MASTVAWMPIREEDERTDSVPFDFVTERMIQVSRKEDGLLMIDQFNEQLALGRMKC